MAVIPPFGPDGLLPPGDYELSFAELRQSVLVLGPGDLGAWPTWDRTWRAKLVDNLEVLTRQLWQVGITDVFADGSFSEDKDHPNDIDGYFVCDLHRLKSGELTRELNFLDPDKTRSGRGTLPLAGRIAVTRSGSFPCGTSTEWNSTRTCRVSGSAVAFATSTGTSWSSPRRSASRGVTERRGDRENFLLEVSHDSQRD